MSQQHALRRLHDPSARAVHQRSAASEAGSEQAGRDRTSLPPIRTRSNTVQEHVGGMGGYAADVPPQGPPQQQGRGVGSCGGSKQGDAGRVEEAAGCSCDRVVRDLLVRFACKQQHYIPRSRLDGTPPDATSANGLKAANNITRQNKLPKKPQVASRLDDLLENTLAMQKMFLKHMMSTVLIEMEQDSNNRQIVGEVQTARNFEGTGSSDEREKMSREENLNATRRERERIPPQAQRRRSSTLGTSFEQDGDQDDF
eukprot:763893-Hanusia_phi.AAC.4